MLLHIFKLFSHYLFLLLKGHGELDRHKILHYNKCYKNPLKLNIKQILLQKMSKNTAQVSKILILICYVSISVTMYTKSIKL